MAGWDVASMWAYLPLPYVPSRRMAWIYDRQKSRDRSPFMYERWFKRFRTRRLSKKESQAGLSVNLSRRSPPRPSCRQERGCQSTACALWDERKKVFSGMSAHKERNSA